MAELSDINKSGELTEIKLSGTDAEKVVLTKEQIEALFGNYSFDGDTLKINGGTIIAPLGGLAAYLKIQNGDLE